MRHILTFKTSFTESTEYTHPKGYSICKFLETELSRSGFKVQPLDNYRDIAWSVDCDINSKRIFFLRWLPRYQSNRLATYRMFEHWIH